MPGKRLMRWKWELMTVKGDWTAVLLWLNGRWRQIDLVAIQTVGTGDEMVTQIIYRYDVDAGGGH